MVTPHLNTMNYYIEPISCNGLYGGLKLPSVSMSSPDLQNHSHCVKLTTHGHNWPEMFFGHSWIIRSVFFRLCSTMWDHIFVSLKNVYYLCRFINLIKISTSSHVPRHFIMQHREWFILCFENSISITFVGLCFRKIHLDSDTISFLFCIRTQPWIWRKSVKMQLKCKNQL